MSELIVPLQLQDDGGAVDWVLTQQNVPYAGALGTPLGSVLGFVVVYIVDKAAVSSTLNRILDRRGVNEHARKSLMKIVTLTMAFVALGAGLTLAGLGNILQPFAAIGAAATLAIDFTMQGVIANFVTDIFIFVDKPSHINNWTEWDGNAGIAEDIPLRVTCARTFGNEPLTVPNSQLIDDVIENPAAKDKLCLQVPFGIGYSDDI